MGPRRFPRLEEWLAEEEDRAPRLAVLLGMSSSELDRLRAGRHIPGDRLHALAVAATGDPAILEERPEVVELLKSAPAVTPAQYRRLAAILSAEAS